MAQEEVVARAYAPAHITGFFKIYSGGSTGAGMNLADGAETLVRIGAVSADPGQRITINGDPAEAPVSRVVLDRFNNLLSERFVQVEHVTAFPVGFGLGMSGAGVFTLSLAINKALGAPLTFKECQKIAAEAEIECGTGLGTVMSQEFVGIIFGLPPFPSTKVQNIVSELNEVVCAFFEPINTAAIIRDPSWKEKINEAGTHCMKELEAAPSVDRLIALSRLFTEVTGLAGAGVKEAMRRVPEASMAMLGQTVFALTRDVERVRREFSLLTPRVQVSTIATRGAGTL